MVTQAWKASDFLGLTPAIDHRRSDKFFVLSGQNYFFDSIGPKSGFANRYVTPYPFYDPAHIQGVRLFLTSGERSFTLTNTGILEWNETAGVHKILYVIPDAINQPYRWSVSYLNGYVYFAHPACGLLAMDTNSDIILPVDSAGAPTNVLACCVCNARLVVISPFYYYWSAPSNGLDWVPRLSGPGFQTIANHVSGEPIICSSYGKGVLTWTTSGVMRAEFNGDQTVWNFKALNTEFHPINSMCSLQIDDSTVLILDERGLFTSAGDIPQPFAPLFNEYLIEFIRRNKLRIGANMRLEWDAIRRLLYLSYSTSQTDPIYENAFVYYPPIDRWGQFNESHYGILPVSFDSGDRIGNYFGFVDHTGRHRVWLDGGSREILPANPMLNSVYPLSQVPAHVDPVDDCLVCSSSWRVSPVANFLDASPAGYFQSSATIRASAEIEGLAAQISLGLLRFDQVQAMDMMTEINQIMIGSADSDTGDVDGMDFNIIPAGTSEEDYNLVGSARDYGLDPLNQINCDVRVISTVDGRTEFQSVTPTLFDFKRGMRYYSGNTSGLWHIVELTASTPGDAFHLGVVELTASQAGRYS